MKTLESERKSYHIRNILKRWLKLNPKKVLAFLSYNLFLAILLAPFIVFRGPFQSLKEFAVGTIYTSRHPQIVQIFLSQSEIYQIMSLSSNQGVGTGAEVSRSNVTTDPAAGITMEDIQGKNFRGKVLLISDPKRVKLAVTNQLGITGERITSLVRESGAIAGINAGGFYDPNGKGNGAFPDGITVHNGQIVHNNVENTPVHIVGLNADGKLIVKDLDEQAIKEAGIKEAVTFSPDLIVDGQPVLKGDGGWGIAPRTGIGQTADGTMIFVVIDGRQPTWSIGATLRDLMNVFIDYNAVTAVNLDGGSSSELVYNSDVMNHLCNIFGERYIPTAFVVMPN